VCSGTEPRDRYEGGIPPRRVYRGYTEPPPPVYLMEPCLCGYCILKRWLAHAVRTLRSLPRLRVRLEKP